MGKAYLYEAFKSAGGNTSGLADKTKEYNEVMRSPARETQFLIMKGNSDYVIPDLETNVRISIVVASENVSVTANKSYSKTVSTSQLGYVHTFDVPKGSETESEFTISTADETTQITSITVLAVTTDFYLVTGTATQKVIKIIKKPPTSDTLFFAATETVEDDTVYYNVSISAIQSVTVTSVQGYSSTQTTHDGKIITTFSVPESAAASATFDLTLSSSSLFIDEITATGTNTITDITNGKRIVFTNISRDVTADVVVKYNTSYTLQFTFNDYPDGIAFTASPYTPVSTTSTSKTYTITRKFMSDNAENGIVFTIYEEDNSNYPVLTDVSGNYSGKTDVNINTKVLTFTLKDISANTTIAISLTDMYYDPTGRTWNKLDIATGNGWVETDEYPIFGTLLQSRYIVRPGFYTYPIELPFYEGADYKFMFTVPDSGSFVGLTSVYPDKIRVKFTDERLSPTSPETSGSGYVEYPLIKDETNGAVVWENSNISDQNVNYVRLCFSGFTGNVKPLVMQAEAYYDVDNPHPDSSYDDLTGIYFDGEDIIGVDITAEVNKFSRDLPYSSYSVVLNDEYDRFNPLGRNNLQRYFVKYQDFDFYTMSRNADNDIWYITKIGRAKLNDIKYSNMTATLSFIGLVEYYDQITLSDTELYFTNHFDAVKVSDYLRALFSNDIDSETLANFENETIITPFTTESKAEILRIIAERFCGYIHETEDGKLAIKRLGTDKFFRENPVQTTPYKLSLDLQTNNPNYQQEHEIPSDYNVNLYTYSPDDNVTLLTDLQNPHIMIDVYASEDENAGISFDKYQFYGSAPYSSNSGDTPVIDNKNIWVQQLLDNDNVKWVKLRFKFDNSYAISTFAIENYFGQSYFDHYGIPYSDTISLYNLWQFGNDMFRNASGTATGGVTFCENYIDVCAKKSGNTRRPDNYNQYIVVGTETTEDLTIRLVFTAAVMLYQITARAVTSDTVTYISQAAGAGTSADSSYSIDNPLLTKVNDLTLFYRYYSNIYNNYRYTIDVTDWIGNAALSITDKTLVGFPLRANGNKSFENYYTGEIVKKQISYDGSYSEDLTLVTYPQKYYQREMKINGQDTEITNPIVNNVYTYSDIALKAGSGFEFSMESNINL